MKKIINTIAGVSRQDGPHFVSAISVLAVTMLMSACGGSSGSDPAPDPIVNTTSTDDIKGNASSNIGNSLDTTLNGVSRVTSGGDSSGLSTDDPADNGIGGLWSDDAQSLISTSLDLASDENTVRDGARITVDPDDSAVCSE